MIFLVNKSEKHTFAAIPHSVGTLVSWDSPQVLM